MTTATPGGPSGWRHTTTPLDVLVNEFHTLLMQNIGNPPLDKYEIADKLLVPSDFIQQLVGRHREIVQGKGVYAAYSWVRVMSDSTGAVSWKSGYFLARSQGEYNSAANRELRQAATRIGTVVRGRKELMPTIHGRGATVLRRKQRDEMDFLNSARDTIIGIVIDTDQANPTVHIS